MKIIQVCHAFYPRIGGVESYVYEISKRLAKKYDVYVYTTDPTGKLPKEELIDGIKVRRFKSIAPNDAYFLSIPLYFNIKNEHCDILHANSFSAFPSFLAYLAINRRTKKFIFTPHFHPVGSTPLRTFLHKFYDPIQKKLFDRADKVVCLTNYEKDLVHKKFNIPFEKIEVIPNGITPEEFRIKKPAKQFDFEILYVGRIEKYKNIHKVFPALKSLLQRHPDTDIHFTIIGKGPYKSKLNKLARKFNISNIISYEQDLSRKDLIERYKRADVFVMPSEYEAFCITVLESIASQTPVVISNLPTIKEFAPKNGSFVFRNTFELRDILEYIMQNRPKFEFEYERYSWDNVTKKVENIYKDS